jgi:hypothetical protein
LPATLRRAWRRRRPSAALWASSCKAPRRRLPSCVLPWERSECSARTPSTHAPWPARRCARRAAEPAPRLATPAPALLNLYSSCRSVHPSLPIRRRLSWHLSWRLSARLARAGLLSWMPRCRPWSSRSARGMPTRTRCWRASRQRRSRWVGAVFCVVGVCVPAGACGGAFAPGGWVGGRGGVCVWWGGVGWGGGGGGVQHSGGAFAAHNGSAVQRSSADGLPPRISARAAPARVLRAQSRDIAARLAASEEDATAAKGLVLAERERSVVLEKARSGLVEVRRAPLRCSAGGVAAMQGGRSTAVGLWRWGPAARLGAHAPRLALRTTAAPAHLWREGPAHLTTDGRGRPGGCAGVRRTRAR